MSRDFNFTRYNVFGWIIHRKTLQAGEQFEVKIPEGYTQENLGNISLWTKGLVTGVNRLTGEPTQQKTPGHSILQAASIEPADDLFTAQVDSEFWCINYIINRKKLPKVDIVDLQTNERLQGYSGSPIKFLLCEGVGGYRDIERAGPAALLLTEEFTAYSRCLGFVFKE